MPLFNDLHTLLISIFFFTRPEHARYVCWQLDVKSVRLRNCAPYLLVLLAFGISGVIKAHILIVAFSSLF